ncbi:DegT/DnrJ/EryC1/StrS family aminotransferase [Candidatus Pelagibacter ubique]|nr:DegT/DnrJ/EryC1/StrS family aminotransferase [Candidatus Pelagibacter ubique]
MIKYPYVNLGKQHQEYKKKFTRELTKVMNSGSFILGSNVKEFEKEFSHYIGTKYAVGVGNGTDALYLSLKFLNLKPNDEVITVSNSYLSTVSSIYLAGSKARLIDVNYNDYQISVDEIKKNINKKTKAIIAVHLCGIPCDIEEIKKICKYNNITIIEDCAQAAGAMIKKKKVGSFGLSGCFSFHPLKNLNALGDGGIITTNNKKFYNWLMKARNNGHSSRDDCEFWSHNMRLDELHASFLRIKLKNYHKVLKKRNNNVRIYKKIISNLAEYPFVKNSNLAIYQTFIIKIKNGLRNKLQKFLLTEGFDTKVHYPLPVHKMNVYMKKYKKINLPISEKLSKEILTLPVMEYVDKDHVTKLANKIKLFLTKFSKN